MMRFMRYVRRETDCCINEDKVFSIRGMVVSGMLRYFAGVGIVEISRGGIMILDKKRLRSLAL